jgi:hypothetical protein
VISQSLVMMYLERTYSSSWADMNDDGGSREPKDGQLRDGMIISLIFPLVIRVQNVIIVC